MAEQPSQSPESTTRSSVSMETSATTSMAPPAGRKTSKWAKTKDRIVIGLVVLALLVLAFSWIDGSVMNFQCSFTEFITFECNRWDRTFVPWDQLKHR